MPRNTIVIQRSFMLAAILITLPLPAIVRADEMLLTLRSLRQPTPNSVRWERQTEQQRWDAKDTAVIVCDVWDLHHSLNAVRRLEEFAPRLNQVIAEARRRGATIIHSPSDCMAAYEDHPARQRAVAVPKAADLPRDIRSWCSRIPSEQQAVYPIDQSDGGADDEPAEHAEWAAKLASLGRDPGLPWKKQSERIMIDSDRDFISDRGDEVWSILQKRKIQNVILTGVHTNMCVLGRPFGLRQMARHGKRVVLMRDLTDCMYNPQRWPYVDHFTGNDLIIAHVERFVCPTITSDQLLGGQPFRSKSDKRSQVDIISVDAMRRTNQADFEKDWSLLTVPSSWDSATRGAVADYEGVAWYRCAVRTPADWVATDGLRVRLAKGDGSPQAWLNGHPLRVEQKGEGVTLEADPASLELDDVNLLVLRLEHRAGDGGLSHPPLVDSNGRSLPLKGRWQFRLGDDPAWSNIPLPARYGVSPDIVFEPARL
jgi:nicotinamidase-related amidase